MAIICWYLIQVYIWKDSRITQMKNLFLSIIIFSETIWSKCNKFKCLVKWMVEVYSALTNINPDLAVIFRLLHQLNSLNVKPALVFLSEMFFFFLYNCKFFHIWNPSNLFIHLKTPLFFVKTHTPRNSWCLLKVNKWFWCGILFSFQYLSRVLLVAL